MKKCIVCTARKVVNNNIECCYCYKIFLLTMLRQPAITKKQPEIVNMFNLINLGSPMIVEHYKYVKKLYTYNTIP